MSKAVGYALQRLNSRDLQLKMSRRAPLEPCSAGRISLFGYRLVLGSLFAVFIRLQAGSPGKLLRKPHVSDISPSFADNRPNTLSKAIGYDVSVNAYNFS